MDIIFYKIVFFITVVEALLMAATIVAIKKRPRFTLYYSLLNLFMAGWSFGKLMSLIVDRPESALFWLRIACMFSIFIYYVLYKSIVIFTEAKENKYYDGIALSLCAVLFIFNTSDIVFNTSYILGGVSRAGVFYYYEIAGSYYTLYLLSAVFSFTFAFALIIKGYSNMCGLNRLQLKYVTVAVLLASFAVGSTFFYALNINLVPLLIVALPLHFPIIFYAAFSQRLLGHNFFINSFYVNVFLALIVFLVVYLFIQVSVFFGSSYTEKTLFINIIFSSIFAAIFIHVVNFFRRVGSRAFTRGQDPYEMKRNIILEIGKTEKIEDLRSSLIDNLSSYLNIESAYVIITSNAKNDLPHVIFLDHNQFSLGETEYYSFSDVLRFENQALLRSEVLAISSVYKKNLKVLDDICGRVELLLPLVAENKLVALLIFNSKINGDSFTKDDLDFLDSLKQEIAGIVDGLVCIRKKEERLRELEILEGEFYKVIKKKLYIPGQELAKKLEAGLEGGDEINVGYLEDAMAKTEAIGEMVQDFLLASEIESRHFLFDLVPTNLSNLLKEIVDGKKKSATDKNLKLDLSLPDNDTYIMSNRPFIRQAIVDVINNSLNYTKEGRVSISLCKSFDGDKAIIKFFDTGIGIPAEDIAYIFYKFVQVNNTLDKNVSGSGLGLYNARQIINRHEDGRIYVEKSEVGIGTSVVIEVSIAKKLDF